MLKMQPRMTDRELQARKRIERDLHDGVQQDLVAIVVKLQLARRLAETDRAAAAALLDEIRGDAQAALEATRALAARIYPPLLDSVGLKAALRAAAPEATVDVDLGDECPEAIAAAAYFACLDLLPASAISIRREGDAVSFEVENDATGRVSGSLPV
jgi:signal transduction histidine kinase